MLILNFLRLRMRAMTLFELVKIVLDELYVEAEEMYGTQVDDKIKARMAYLTAVYYKLSSSEHEPIDYKDPATRFAYVYKYVPAHGDYVFQILNSVRSKIDEPVFFEQDARLSCIGGGPGSDLIGVLKYIDYCNEKEPVRAITAYLLDREQAWSDTWTEVNTKFDLDIKFHSAFQPFDVTLPNSWESQRRFLKADLFTLSYFVSEVMALDEEGKVSKFWNILFTGAKIGAYLLYLDNGHTHFTEYFDERWKAGGGWQIIDSGDNTRFTPSGSEQASEVAEYKGKFGRSPKIQGVVTYRILRKIK